MSQHPPPAQPQYAGYAQFYGNSAPPRGPPMRPPPPPRGFSFQQQAPAYAYQQQAPQQVQYPYPPPPRPPFQPRPHGSVLVPPRPPGPPRAMVPPRPVAPQQPSAGSKWDKAPHPPPQQVNSTSNQWQWGTGRAENQQPNPAVRYGPATEVANAAPKMYNRTPPTVSKFSSQPPPSVQAPPPGVESTQWPPALKAYVERAFNSARTEVDKSRVQALLKEKIASALAANQLWTKNWNAEPLPLEQQGSTMTAPGHMGPRPMHMRPPPPRPLHAGPRPLVPPPRPGMVPPRGFVPPPRPSGFIPLDTSANKFTKQPKRKMMDDPDGHDVKRKLKRQQRFLKDSFVANKTRAPTVDEDRPLQVLNDDGELDLEAMIIKGTCQIVEKEYLRLTSAPHPSTVRPEPVLHKALEMVRKKWKKGKCDYVYVCSQMKSIRQDCTVQHIKNTFTVRAYESHARIALEEGDMNEFNQCQTQLSALYDAGIDGCGLEFLAYRVLYCIYVCLQAKADVNTGNVAMAKVLSRIKAADRDDETVAHALDVREAVALNNYTLFFHLYAAAPKMSGYIMDAYVDHMRLQALRIMCKAYQPHIPLAYVKEMLRLEGDDGDAFVAESGLAYVDADRTLIDVKASAIVAVRSNAKSLL